MRVRSQAMPLEAIESARQEERSIAWSWFMRGTLHLVRVCGAVHPVLTVWVRRCSDDS